MVKHHLPIEYHIADVEAFYSKFFLDKKSSNDTIKFILPNGIGEFEMHQGIDAKVVKEVLKKFSGNSD